MFAPRTVKSKKSKKKMKKKPETEKRRSPDAFLRPYTPFHKTYYRGVHPAKNLESILQLRNEKLKSNKALQKTFN